MEVTLKGEVETEEDEDMKINDQDIENTDQVSYQTQEWHKEKHLRHSLEGERKITDQAVTLQENEEDSEDIPAKFPLMTTAIGLPRSMRQKNKKTAIPFFRKTTWNRQIFILKLFLEEDKVNAALMGRLIEESDTECLPQNIPGAVMTQIWT